jgi:hypothetical protein
MHAVAVRLAGLAMLLGGLCIPVHGQTPGAGASPRYLDFTARNDGWAAAQTAAIIGSKEHRVVLISYADPGTTRAFYDLAQRYAAPPHSVPIFGVVRAPDHPAESSANGFDIYLNGVPLGDVENPDEHFSQLRFLELLLGNISADYRSGKLGARQP